MNLNSISWLPKLGGFLVLLGGVLAAAVKLGAPHAFEWIGPSLVSLGGGIGLLAARQDNRSSEQVGAGNVPPKDGAA